MKNVVSLPALSLFRPMFARKPWKEALPSALDDAVLRGLAACIAMSGVSGQVAESVDDRLAVDLLSAYQFSIGREIIGRLTEGKSESDEQAFLAFVHQRVCESADSNSAIDLSEPLHPTAH